ncbi:baeRF3 domain-containing protein [Desulfolithobacter sp.]
MNFANKAITIQEKLVNLLNKKEKPAVSIIIGNEARTTENAALRIALKDEIKKVRETLGERGYSKRLVRLLEEKMQQAMEEVDFTGFLYGIGIFVSENEYEILYFPFQVTSKTTVDTSFEIRDLLMTVNRSFQYDVILLSKKKTRFFNAYGPDIQELRTSVIPEGVDDIIKMKKAGAIDPEKVETDALKKYVRDVDHFVRIFTPVNRPLVVIGDARLQSYFKETTRRPDKIIGEIQGSFDDARVSEIQERVAEIYREFQDKWENQLLDSMQEEIDRLRYVSGLQEVWTVAAMKEGRVLLTERDYRQKGWSVKDGVFLVLGEEKPEEEAEFHEDAVDDIVEMVLSQGGESYFVQPGKLEKYDRIILSTRY